MGFSKARKKKAFFKSQLANWTFAKEWYFYKNFLAIKSPFGLHKDYQTHSKGLFVIPLWLDFWSEMTFQNCFYEKHKNGLFKNMKKIRHFSKSGFCQRVIFLQVLFSPSKVLLDCIGIHHRHAHTHDCIKRLSWSVILYSIYHVLCLL